MFGVRQSFINRLWYRHHPLVWLLYPFALVYQWVVALRRWFLVRFCQIHVDVPVIVVGNLTVGGVGKTPLVIAIAAHLTQKGHRVGIVSRGYGAKLKQFPYQVQLQDDARLVGDEPLLLARKTELPVVISPKRTDAVAYLLKHHQIDVVLSDDGLQHERMGRAIEIIVVDGQRGFGNGWCLPAGPLRESKKRLQRADLIVVNGSDWPGAFRMDLMPASMQPQKIPEDTSIAAFAGIGHPERFFATLSDLGIKYRSYSFCDHHVFVSKDFLVPEDVIVMTEKDAVKCHALTSKPVYILPVRAVLQASFWEKLDAHECLKQ